MFVVFGRLVVSVIWFFCLCLCVFVVVFFFKQKTAYEMRISDWSSDVCSSDLFGRNYRSDVLMTDATAPIGHNNPPEPTPYEAILTDVQDLSETAQGFLDGDPINYQATADMVAKLIDEARKGQKDAEDLRKEEAKTFDAGKKDRKRTSLNSSH